MNRAALQELCWSWLDDPNHTYFTPAQINVWLNNGLRELQKQLIQAGDQWYTTSASSQTVMNYDTYAIPSDFLKTNKFEVVISGSPPNQVRNLLNPVTLVQIDGVSMTTGRPAAYALKKNCFIIRPIPDTVYTMYLDYTYLVSDMESDSSIPDAPLQYHEYIAVMATVDGFLKDQRDPGPFIQNKREFYLKLMKQDAIQRKNDAPRMVVSNGDSDMGYLW